MQIGDGSSTPGSLGNTNISVDALASSLIISNNGALSATTNLTNNGTATFNAPSTTIAALTGTNTSSNVNINGAAILNINAGGSYAGSINGNTLGITGGSFTAASGAQINANNLAVSKRATSTFALRSAPPSPAAST